MEQLPPEPLLDAIGRLASLVEEQLAQIHDKIEHATEVMREQTEEIGVLRDVIDELRELYQWALNNHHDERPRLFQLTSLPLDAAASDFAERVNRYDATEIEKVSTPTVPSTAQTQRDLFETD